jgi:hypothetical protein
MNSNASHSWGVFPATSNIHVCSVPGGGTANEHCTGFYQIFYTVTICG